jgi:hypothetical protein
MKRRWSIQGIAREEQVACQIEWESNAVNITVIYDKNTYNIGI